MKRHERTAAEKAAYLRQWRLDNKEKRKAQRDREYAKNSEKIKARSAEYRKNNPDIVKAAYKRWTEANKEYVREKHREWVAANKEHVYATNSARHKRLRQSIPSWQSKQEIREIYKQAIELSKQGIQYHVDHIIPLQGDLVSGLTVIANLRIIPASENVRKSNKFSVDDIV